MIRFTAPVPKDGPAAGVADAADHGGEGGGQGALAQAAGAARARALAPHPRPLAAPSESGRPILTHCDKIPVKYPFKRNVPRVRRLPLYFLSLARRAPGAHRPRTLGRKIREQYFVCEPPKVTIFLQGKCGSVSEA